MQIFSEDANGNESLVATILAIPDELSETPDKPIIHFDERPAGAPEAIHSWYYPGEDTGWEFIYPKGEAHQTSFNTAPAADPVTTAAAVTAPASAVTAATARLPRAPKVPEEGPAPEVVTVDEEILVAQSNAPAPPYTPEADAQNSADRMLPDTGGHSDLEIMIGLAMLGGGFAAVCASRRKSVA